MQALAREPQPLPLVLDDGFRLAVRGFLPAVGLSAVSILGSLVAFGGTLLADSPDDIALVTLITLPVVMFFSLIATAAVVSHFAALADGRALPFKEALAAGLRLSPRLLLASFLFGIALIIGTLLLVVPGIVLAISLSLFAYPMVLERRGALDALRRSHRLVWGDWWRTMLAITVSAMVAGVFVIGGFVVLSLLLLFTGADAATFGLASDLMGAVAGIFGTPFMYACNLALFHDLRLRRDGPDLTDRADRLLAPAA